MAKTKLISLQKTYQKKIDKLVADRKGFSDLVDVLRRSDDSFVIQKSREENKIYDEKWIANLENGFEAIDMIIKNPRTFIKEDAQVVLAALAKRITSESVQNLAMHSEYVREVKEDGTVTPDKILSISTEEDFQIYENRFVMTLIKKLVIFIERRYQFIKDHGETRNSDVLVIHNVTTIDGVTYECDNRIKVSRPSDDNGQKEHNAELLAKILRLRDRASFYLHCPFMQKMAGAKPVHNPLAMTNMLLKSPTYHKTYELWKFIDSYEKLGITYSVKETNQEFDETYYKEIYGLVMGDILTLNSHQIATVALEPSKSKKKILAPRVLLSLDDETFLDGKFTYHEFPTKEDEAATKKRAKGIQPPTPSEVDAIKLAEEKRAFEEKKKAEEIAAKQAEWKRKQDLKEAMEAAAKRKKLEAQLAKIVAAQQALQKKIEAERIAKEKAAQEKAKQEQLALEAQLLAKTREGVKREASEDRSTDAATLARIEAEREKALELQRKKDEEAAAAAAEQEKEEAALQAQQAEAQAALEAALVAAKDQEEAIQVSAKESAENAKLHVVRLRAIRQEKFVPSHQKFVPIVKEGTAPAPAKKKKSILVAPVIDSEKMREKGKK